MSPKIMDEHAPCLLQLCPWPKSEAQKEYMVWLKLTIMSPNQIFWFQISYYTVFRWGCPRILLPTVRRLLCHHSEGNEGFVFSRLVRWAACHAFWVWIRRQHTMAQAWQCCPDSQMKKQDLKEMELGQGHIARKWQSWDSIPLGIGV